MCVNENEITLKPLKDDDVNLFFSIIAGTPFSIAIIMKNPAACRRV